jgi:hypothetical protein
MAMKLNIKVLVLSEEKLAPVTSLWQRDLTRMQQFRMQPGLPDEFIPYPKSRWPMFFRPCSTGWRRTTDITLRMRKLPPDGSGLEQDDPGRCFSEAELDPWSRRTDITCRLRNLQPNDRTRAR